MEKEKKPPVGGCKEQVTLRIPTPLFEKMKNIASKQGLSINAYILLLIKKALNL